MTREQALEEKVKRLTIALKNCRNYACVPKDVFDLRLHRSFERIRDTVDSAIGTDWMKPVNA